MELALDRWTDDDLGVLLKHRPDLARPAPASFAALATRANCRQSLSQAIADLDRFQGAVLHVCALLGDGPFGIGALCPLLGLGERHHAAVAAAVDALRLRGLLAVEGSGISVPSALHHAIPWPAGLGPPARPQLARQPRAFLDRIAILLGVTDKLAAARGNKAAAVERAMAGITDRGRIEKVLKSAPAGVQAMFDQVVAEGAAIRSTDLYWIIRQRNHPAGWLHERGLLTIAATGLTLPREVGLALRRGVAFPGLTVEPPDLVMAPVPGCEAAGAGASAGAGAVSVVERLVAGWATRPATVLKNGGLGVREMKRPAKAAGVDEATAAMAAELAFAAGLIGLHGAEVRATRQWDSWLGMATGDRWLALVDGWRAVPRWPSLAGRTDTRDKVIPALDPVDTSAAARRQRQLVLAALAEAPAAHAPTADSVEARVGWRAPGAFAEGPAALGHLVRFVLEEASFLGVTASGALTPAGRAVVGGDPAAVGAAVEAAFGRPTSDVTLQADLTAMVVGVADPALRALLDDAADVESQGAATVWRFSATTVRRALDRGRSAGELVSFLTAHATRSVPQPLAYLIADVGRRHGEARVGGAGGYVRSDDAGLLARVVAGKRGRALGLRLLAPTVAVSEAEPAALLAYLRDEGLAPVEEDSHGSTVAVVDCGPRTAAGAGAGLHDDDGLHAGGGVDAGAVVASLRKASEAKGGGGARPTRPAASRMAPATRPKVLPELWEATETAEIRALLTDAAATGDDVDLDWEDRTGGHTRWLQATVRIVALSGPLVIAVGTDRRRLGYRIDIEDIDWAATSGETCEHWLEMQR